MLRNSQTKLYLNRNKKKYNRRGLNVKWVEPDIRDNIVELTKMMTIRTNIPVNKLIGMIGISSSKYYSWVTRFEQPTAPHQHWHIDIKYVKIDIRSTKLQSDKKLRYKVKNVS